MHDINVKDACDVYEGTKSVEETAKHFGCSIPAITRRLKKGGVVLTGNRVNISVRDACKVYEECRSVEKTAKHFGRAHATITRILDKGGMCVMVTYQT